MHEFEPGDPVCLKSGGPIMTVTGYSGANRAVCVWFDEKNVKCSAQFTDEALERVSPDEIEGDS